MRKRRGMFWLCLLMVLCLLCGMTACQSGKDSGGTKDTMTWQNQYDLGIRLLNEGNYEEAILAFQAAIQIDPKNVDAYLGLADVYLAMEDGQAAADILTQGLTAVEDEAGRAALEEKRDQVKQKYPDVTFDSENGGGSDGDGEEDNSENASAGDNDPDSEAVITAMEEAIAAQYDYAGEFSEGYACVGYLQDDGTMKYCYINTQGQVISGLYDYAADFHEGMAAVGIRVDSSDSETWYSWYTCYRYGYINTQGEEVIPLQYILDNEYQGAMSFYEGLAEVAWFSEEYENHVMTNLVDKEGNKVLPADILIRDDRGYGWNPPDDPRQLTLISRDPISEYTQWNPIQRARYRGETGISVKGYDGVSTHWMDETFAVTRSMDGYVTELSGMDGLYVSYTSPVSWDATGDVVDADGNVIIAGISSCQAMHGEYLYVSFYTPGEDPNLLSGSYTYGLFDKNGQQLEMPYASLYQMEDGYIGMDDDQDENYVSTYHVLDLQLEEVFSVKATGLSREASYEYVNSTYVYHALPLYMMSYYDSTSGMYGNVYLDLTGQEILPRQVGVNQTVMDGRYLVCSAEDHVTVYTLEGQEILSMDGISYLSTASMTNVDNVYMAQTTDGQTLYYLGEGTEDSLVLTEVEAYYDPQTDMLVLASDGEEVLMAGDASAVWGSVSDWDQSVTLKQGDTTVTQAKGLSLIGNNLYKKADTIVWNEMQYSYDVYDVSLCTVDGTWSSAVYEQMGTLSENYISFCENGKWGYLQVVK